MWLYCAVVDRQHKKTMVKSMLLFMAIRILLRIVYMVIVDVSYGCKYMIIFLMDKIKVVCS